MRTTLKYSSDNKVVLGSCGMDVGGTKTAVYFSVGPKEFAFQVNSKSYDSCEEMILDQLKHDDIMGFVPATYCLALPATNIDGVFHFANLEWPPVTIAGLADALGVTPEKIFVTNDLVAALHGAWKSDFRHMTEIYRGNTGELGLRRTAITFSTGMNSGSADLSSGGVPMSREMGHVYPTFPPQRLLREYIEFVGDKIGHPATVENLLSGGQGPENVIDFLLDRNETISYPTYGEIENCWKTGSSIGRLMTTLAMDGDPFMVKACEILGGLIGCELQRVAVGELADVIYMQGGLIAGTPGFAQWLVDNTDMITNMVAAGTERSEVAKRVTLFVIDNDYPMAAYGASLLAQEL